jgi:hypothetical protein
MSDITPPEKFQEAVEAFKGFVTPLKVRDLAQRFINGLHGSNAILTCIEALEKGLIENDTDRLLMSLQVIEPLALNRENAEKCINFDLVKKISLILVNNKWTTFDVGGVKNQQILRLVMRSLVPLINIKQGRDQFMQSLNPLSHLVSAIDQCKYNVEIVANGLRILRVLTNDGDAVQRIQKSYKEIMNQVI